MGTLITMSSWKVRFLVKVYGFLWYCAAKDVSNVSYADPLEVTGKEDIDLT